MDNVVIKFTAESDMSAATKDFDELKVKESQIIAGMEQLKKKQEEFAGAPKVISLLDAEYKKLEGDLKTTRTSMEGFAKSTKQVNDTIVAGAVNNKSLRTQIAAIREELSRMEMAGLDSSKAYINLSVEAGKLQDQMGDTQQTIQVLSSDTRTLDTAMGLGRGLAGGFTVATSAAALLGDENEALQKAFFKVQAVMSILNGVQEVANMLNKNSAVMVNIRTAAENSSIISKYKNIVATKLQETAENGGTAAKVASNIAQKALNASMLASPALWVVGGIMALVGVLMLFSKNSKDSTENANKYKSALDGVSFATAEARDNHNEFERKVRDLQIEIDVASGKLSEYRAELVRINNTRLDAGVDAIQEYTDKSTNAMEELKEKLGQTGNWWEKAFAGLKNIFTLGRFQKDAEQEYIDSVTAANNEKYNKLKQSDGIARKEREKVEAEERSKRLADQKAANEKAANEHTKYLQDIEKLTGETTIAVMEEGTDKKLAELDREHKLKMDAIKDNSKKENDLRLLYDELYIKKRKEIVKVKAIEQEKITGEGVIKAFESYQNKKSDILTKAQEGLSKKVQDGIAANTEGLKEQYNIDLETIKFNEQRKQAIIQESVDLIYQIGNSLFQARKDQLDQELSDLEYYYTTDAEEAKNNKDLKLISEQELAKKKLEIKIKQAKVDKEQALFNIAIDTITAAISSLKTDPSGILAGIITASGLYAGKEVAKKPLPKYSKGKKAEGKGHFATVGELGAETMWIPDNAAIIPHNRALNFDTFKDFNIPIDFDSKHIKSSEIDYDRLGESVGKYVKIPQPKPVTVHVDKSGVNVNYGQGNTTYLNKKYTGSWN